MQQLVELSRHTTSVTSRNRRSLRKPLSGTVRPKVDCLKFERPHSSIRSKPSPLLYFRNERSAQRGSFLGRTSRGCPEVIRADIPAQNFGQGSRNSGKTSISARTSRTLRDFQKLRSANFGLKLQPPWGWYCPRCLGEAQSDDCTTCNHLVVTQPCSDLGPELFLRYGGCGCESTRGGMSYFAQRLLDVIARSCDQQID